MKLMTSLLTSSALSITMFIGPDLKADSITAHSELEAKSGSSVEGILTFEQNGNQLNIQGEIKGLTPGLHGFHVHEKGDCSAEDATSAGGHFDHASNPHGAPHSHQRHTGDFGNIEADQNGVAKVDLQGLDASLTGEGSIMGRAVIVHADKDDLSSQPSGNAGARVACGIIREGTPSKG